MSIFRYSRYFQTLKFIFYIYKGLITVGLLLAVIGFSVLESCYRPEKYVETTTVAREKTDVFLIQDNETFVREEVESENVRNENYCEILLCKTIKCSSISDAHNPGEITSRFIERTFKDKCPNQDRISLMYVDCKFPSNAVQKDWLKIDLSIDQLTFNRCSLNRIDDDAFSDRIFKKIETLSISDNEISSLNRTIFQKFVQLKQLLVQKNIVGYAESDLLADVANSLEVLQLDGAIKDREVLGNITGKKILSNLKILSIQDNLISVLGPDLFTGVPQIISLFAERSEITEITSKTFESMGDTLKQLYLRDNDLSTLPDDIFDFVRSSTGQFSISLSRNTWHCDCKFKWIQEFIRKYPDAIVDGPLCSTPDINGQLTFDQARFCNESITDTSTNPTTWYDKGSSTKKDTIGVFCTEIVTNSFQFSKKPNRILRSVDYTFEVTYPSYVLTELNNGNVMVSLPNLEDGAVLLWFENRIQWDGQASIYCAKNVKGSYLLKNISPSTSYTVCLTSNQEDGFSPLNCLGITTKPGIEDRTWLANRHKTVVCLVLTALLIFLCAVSAICMFIAVRRHPSLIKGSKRVVLIKKRNLQAMILPKGVEMDENGRINGVDLEGPPPVKERFVKANYSSEDGYVTPIPPNKPPFRKDSRTSRISFQSYGASYIYGIEPTFWKLNRSKSEIASDETAGPPPLPPLPQRVVPSVSMAIDSINAKNDFNETL